MAAEIIELFPKSEDSDVSISFKMGLVAGKVQLWDQLPLEWKISAEGIKLNELVKREAEQLLKNEQLHKLLNKE